MFYFLKQTGYFLQGRNNDFILPIFFKVFSQAEGYFLSLEKKLNKFYFSSLHPLAM